MGFFRRKQVWIPLVAILVLAIVSSFFRGSEDGKTEDIAFSEVIAAARDGRLERVHVVRRQADVTMQGDTTKYVANISAGTDVVRALEDAGATIGGSAPDAVTVEFKGSSAYGNLVGLLIAYAPVIIFPFILYYAVKLAVREALRERHTDPLS